MLVQVVALLSLGVLCSSAPLQATRPASTRRHSPEQKSSGVGSIIREVLQDIKKLDLNAVPKSVTVNTTVPGFLTENAMMERCMHSHLKTFADNLAALNNRTKSIAVKLNRIMEKDENGLLKDLYKECKTAQVMTVQVKTDVLLEALDNFLRLLFEESQSA